jgi:[ribosomal protein S18]-alanine N-acetyltransferase
MREINMLFTFKPMTRSAAEQISTWTYLPPYDLYSFEPDEESIEELMNGEYFYAMDELDQIVGYFCYGGSARVRGGYEAGIYEDENRLDIGLGMKPALTGKGQGSLFVAEGMRFLENQLNQNDFRLVVASFNKRAMQVYAKNGFYERSTFLSKIGGEDVEFVWMETE